MNTHHRSSFCFWLRQLFLNPRPLFPLRAYAHRSSSLKVKIKNLLAKFPKLDPRRVYKKQKRWLFLLLFATSCGSQMSVRQTAMNQRALEEARNALLDVKQALAEQQLDMQLLEEKLAEKQPGSNYNPNVSRLDNLANAQRRILEDLKQLGTHANETSHALAQFKKSIQTLEKELHAQSNRLNEVVKLKSTLTSISHAMDQNARIHKVRSGDSLDRIARKYNTSVQSLKQANGLSSNTILIGQELKIP